MPATIQDIATFLGTDAAGVDVYDDILNTLKQQLAQIEHLEPFKADHAATQAALASIVTEREEFAAIRTERDELKALYEEMAVKVQVAKDSGDPAQFLAVAELFLTPIKQRRDAEIDAQIAALAALKSTNQA